MYSVSIDFKFGINVNSKTILGFLSFIKNPRWRGQCGNLEDFPKQSFTLLHKFCLRRRGAGSNSRVILSESINQSDIAQLSVGRVFSGLIPPSTISSRRVSQDNFNVFYHLLHFPRDT